MKNRAAFPVIERDSCGNPTKYHLGMTLRDYFAGQALNAIISKEDNLVYDRTCGKSLDEWRQEMIATDVKYCYEIADKMLAQAEDF